MFLPISCLFLITCVAYLGKSIIDFFKWRELFILVFKFAKIIRKFECTCNYYQNLLKADFRNNILKYFEKLAQTLNI